nr:hypothetical protein [Tanacetum cinerariifolium]
MTTSSTNNSVFRGFFEKQKLTGPNFIDWYQQLRIVLSIEDKLNYLEQPIPPASVAPAGQHVAPKILAAHNAWIKGSKQIAGLMLMTMDPEIQRNLEPLHAHEMLREPEEGQSVSLYVLKMKGYIDNLEHLGHPMTLGLGGLRASRKLKPRALSLYVGNGQREAVKVIGAFYLRIPSGLEIVLNNFHYASSITRGVISVSRFAIPRDGIFEIDLSNSLTNERSIYAVSNKKAKLDLDSALLWHCRLGNISKKCIEKLQHDGLLDSSDLRAFEKCVSCMSGTMARKPYTHQVKRAKDLLGLIHTDVCGPFKIMSRQGASYFVTFIEDFSQFLDHLKDHGIIAHRTPPYTPQHNGVSKRRNRTLLDMFRSMMSQITLPNSFWDYALETVARILNMVPNKKALVKRDTLTKPEKLEPRSIKCIFIGYPIETMGYSFYYPPENKVLVARNAEFLENSLINQEASRSLEDLEIIQEEDTYPSINTSLIHEDDDLEIDEPQSDNEHELRDLGEPANYKAALLDPESEKWLNAMNVEMQSIKDNDVCVLVELPPNGKTVDSKWLFKKKTNMDRSVHIYKARLVAKGYTQTPGIDYEETFSLVADIRAIRILIAIAAIPMLQSVKTYLGKCFAMKDLGETAYIPGIKIYRDRSRRLIGLCQSAYIEKILKRYCMENFKRGSIPMQENLKLSKSQGTSTPAELKRMKNVSYALASAKQSIFATSSVEAEYIAVFDASKEVVRVIKFIFGLGVVPIIEEPITMYYNNTKAIAIANKSGITKASMYNVSARMKAQKQQDESWFEG